MSSSDLQAAFEELRALLVKHGKGLAGYEECTGSKARGNKSAYHLYGKKLVSIQGRKAQQTYIAGIVLQKNFVGLYSMPIYSHPASFDLKPEGLGKALKGKSCIHVKTLTPDLLEEIEGVVVRGVELYREEGWI